jgi:hypothetical protein
MGPLPGYAGAFVVNAFCYLLLRRLLQLAAVPTKKSVWPPIPCCTNATTPSLGSQGTHGIDS